MVGVERSAEIRRAHFVVGVGIRALARSHRPRSQDDPPGAARRWPAALRARAGGLEARPPQGGDPPPARGRSAPSGHQDPGADHRDRLRGRAHDPRRVPARGPPAVRPAAPHLPAHALPPGRALPVRPLGAEPADPGRLWPGAPRLGGRRLPGLFAGRRRRAHLLQERPRHPLGLRPLPVGPGRPSRPARLGSRGRPSWRRRPAERCLRRLLRSAAGRLAPLRGRRPRGQGGVRAPAGAPT